MKRFRCFTYVLFQFYFNFAGTIKLMARQAARAVVLCSYRNSKESPHTVTKIVMTSHPVFPNYHVRLLGKLYTYYFFLV